MFHLFSEQIAISNPNPEVLLTLSKSDVVELIGKEWYFVRVHDAVQVCLQHVQQFKEVSNTSQASLSMPPDNPSLLETLQKQREQSLSNTDLEAGTDNPPLPKDTDSRLEPLLSRKS